MEKITLFKVNVKIILLFNLTQEALSPTPLTQFDHFFLCIIFVELMRCLKYYFFHSQVALKVHQVRI